MDTQYLADKNILATDSPFAITYTESAYDEDYRYVNIKLAPNSGTLFMETMS